MLLRSSSAGSHVVSIRLKAITIQPRAGGWTTGQLDFGQRFTFVRGPNGSGKTPIIKAIVFGLGCPVEIPPEIASRCSRVELEVESAKGLFTITRAISDENFDVRVEHAGAEPLQFSSQKEFSEWVLGEMGIKTPTLLTKHNSKTPVYIGNVIPALWIDQDHGWSSVYAPISTQNFILNQQQEILRLILGLAPKRPFDQREEYETKKRELATIDERIGFKRLALERERQYLDTTARPLDESKATRAEVIRELDGLGTNLDLASSTIARFENLIRDQSRICDQLRSRASSLDRQVRRLDTTQSDLDAEIEILTSNDTAADFFREFCGKDDCSLFRNSQISYGRRLLYLKDQIKDLQTTGQGVQEEARAASEDLTKEEQRLQAIEATRQKALEETGLPRLTVQVQQLSKQLAQLEVAIARREQFSDEVGRLNELIESRNSLEGQVKALRPGKAKADSRAKQLQSDLAHCMKEWLEVLRTPNITGTVEINDELEPLIDGQRFHTGSSHSGSTRTRIVLAYRAALLQTALEHGGAHPGLMIFDAPRQQEIQPDDLRHYLQKLGTLSDTYPTRCQIIVAISEELLPLSENDHLWTPRFVLDDKPQFFGGPSAPSAAL